MGRSNVLRYRGAGGARSCTNCPADNCCPQLFRDNSWRSGWHQLLLTLFVPVLVDVIHTHTHSHTHLLTHICFHIAQLCLAPMDRWPPSTHMVGRHPNSLTTTTRSAASASQLSLFGSFSGNFYLNYWCPVFVYFYIMCYLLLCSFMDLTRCLFMGWSKMFNLKKRHQ